MNNSGYVAALATWVPLGYVNRGDAPKLRGYRSPAGQREPSALYNAVSPAYFRTMRIRMLRGRDFSDADRADAPHVAIIDEAMAQRYWPDQDSLGRQFGVGSDPKHVLTVIGIVRNVATDLTSGAQPCFYVPLAQKYQSGETLHLRVKGKAEAIVHDVEAVIQSLAPTMPVFDVRSMTDAMHTLNGLLLFQLASFLAGGLGLLALILAVVGIYGVVSYNATQRTHEIGIRIALGARSIQILSRMFAQGVLIVLLGIALGLTISMGASQLFRGVLVGVRPIDPLTYILVSSLMALTALAAGYLPLRRVLKFDPVTALRYE
jgi:putative ABC transport system permease protein